MNSFGHSASNSSQANSTTRAIDTAHPEIKNNMLFWGAIMLSIGIPIVALWVYCILCNRRNAEIPSDVVHHVTVAAPRSTQLAQQAYLSGNRGPTGNLVQASAQAIGSDTQVQTI